MEYIDYTIRVDGHIISKITLPVVMSIQKRNDIKSGIAATYSIPQHYIRLQPTQYRAIKK